MDLLRSGNKGKLMEIETNEFMVAFSGELSNKRSADFGINKNVPAKIFVKWNGIGTVTLRTLTDFGNLVENSGVTMMPCFFEDGQYQLIIELKEAESYSIYHGGIDITNNFNTYGKVILGTIDFSSDIGYTNIDIFKGIQKVLSITLEVFPTKLDYYKDYKELIEEINEEVSSLAFKFIDKTYLQSKLKDVDYQTNTEYINILEYIFDDLINSLERIEERFKHNVISDNRLTTINKAKKISSITKSYLRTHPEILYKSNNGFIQNGKNKYIPLKVIEEKKSTTIDIFENRYVRYMIQRIIKRLNAIEKIISKKYNNVNSYLDLIIEKKRILNLHLNRHFKDIGDLTGKKSMSLIFQMAPGYKELYTKYSLLNKGLDLGDDLFRITPKKLYSLYEMWCYIKIHKILTELGYEIEEYGILGYKDTGMYLTLLQESEAKMVYKNNRNKLELWYNKSYESPTTNQRPDTALYIKKINKEQDSRVYIFDAKYRVFVDNIGVVGPMEEDINVMHRYRDSIVSKMGNDFKYKYETFGAYVMFPYGDEEKYRNHKFYKSIEEVNVGAFPMLPGSTKLIKKHLKKIIHQSDIEAKSERISIDEYDDYAKFKLENVMVVNVKDSKHLKAYKENQFYHIPAKRLNNIRLGVEYLAFYQSIKSFGDEGGIRYYAKIKDIIRYKRKDCIEIPFRIGTENEEYLRFNLEEIKTIDLVKPIQFGTQFISYTTLYLLLNAENMHELKLRSNLEIELYKRLKAMANENNLNIRKESDRYIINRNVVEIIEGEIIRVNGKKIKIRDIEKAIKN